MKVYDIMPDDSLDGMYKISLVDSPASHVDFVKLKDEGVIKLSVDQDKRIVVGPLLVPNKLIYRNSEFLGEHYIRFTYDSIEKLGKTMFKNMAAGEAIFNTDHLQDLSEESVSILGLWQKEGLSDLSASYGFNDLPVGTLFLKAKIEDDALWQDIKTGRFNGFSPEMITKKIQIKEKTNSMKLSADKKFSVKEAVVGQPVFVTESMSLASEVSEIVVDEIKLKVENGFIVDVEEKQEDESLEVFAERVSATVLESVTNLINEKMMDLEQQMTEKLSELIPAEDTNLSDETNPQDKSDRYNSFKEYLKSNDVKLK